MVCLAAAEREDVIRDFLTRCYLDGPGFYDLG